MEQHAGPLDVSQELVAEPDATMGALSQFDDSMRATRVVFGARDAAGNYATRVSVVVGPVAGNGAASPVSGTPAPASPGAFEAVLGILLKGSRP